MAELRLNQLLNGLLPRNAGALRNPGCLDDIGAPPSFLAAPQAETASLDQAKDLDRDLQNAWERTVFEFTTFDGRPLSF